MPIYTPPVPGTIGNDALFGGIDPRIPSAGAVVGGANRAWFVRVLARKSGFVRDLTIGVAVSSGLIDIGVYDTGETTSAVATRIASWAAANAGVAQACPAASGSPAVTWDPGAGALPVAAGREYLIMVSNDNNTAQLYRHVGAIQVLPSGFYPGSSGTMLSKPYGVVASTITLGVLPATVAEATLSALAASVWVYGRISPT